MARVFQDFLFNFTWAAVQGWEVKHDRFAWHAESESDPTLALLPRMEMDVSLRKGNLHVIVDARYYQSTLSEYYGAPMVHAGSLYQLIRYVGNAERRRDGEVSGMLAYPRIDRPLREKYAIHGHRLTIYTVDLSRDWSEIRDEMLMALNVCTRLPKHCP